MQTDQSCLQISDHALNYKDQALSSTTTYQRYYSHYNNIIHSGKKM